MLKKKSILYQCLPPTLITLSSQPQSACAVTEFFHNAHAYFTIQIRMRSHEFFTLRMRISPSHGCGLRSYKHAVALVLIETESSCDEGCFGFARGLLSSDALTCCQILVLILMVDETDPARDLIQSWWGIRTDWLMILKVDFIDNQRQKKHAKLTRKVTKKQTADKSRLKTNSSIQQVYGTTSIQS